MSAPRDYEELYRDWYALGRSVAYKSRCPAHELDDVMQAIYDRAVRVDLLSRYDPDGGPFEKFWIIYVSRSTRGIVEEMYRKKAKDLLVGIYFNDTLFESQADDVYPSLDFNEEFRELEDYLSTIEFMGFNLGKVLRAMVNLPDSGDRRTAVQTLALTKILGLTEARARAVQKEIMRLARERKEGLGES